MKPDAGFRDQAPLSEVRNQVTNMALGCCASPTALGVDANTQPAYRHFRAGDVRHSLADISKSKSLLGYAPSHKLVQGVAEAQPWYVNENV